MRRKKDIDKKKNSMLALVLAFCALVMLFLVAYIITAISDAMWALSEDRISVISKRGSELFEYAIVDGREYFDEYAVNAQEALKQGNTARAYSYARELLGIKADNGAVAVRFVRPDGTCIDSSGNESLNKLYYIPDNGMLPTYEDKDLDTEVIGFYHHFSEGTEFDGMIMLISSSMFFTRSGISSYNDEGFACITDSEGDIVFGNFYYNEDIEVTNMWSFFSGMELRAAYEEGIAFANTYEDIKYGKMLIAVTPIAGIKGWRLTTVIVSEAIQKTVTSVVTRTVGVLIFVMAIIVILLTGYYITTRNFYRKITNMSSMDIMLGCYNYSKFCIEMPNLCMKNLKVKYAVVYVNVLNFRYINDAFGRKVGDELLFYLNDMYRKLINKEEMYARAEKDHFLFLFSFDRTAELSQKIDAITKGMSNFVFSGDVPYVPKISCGIRIVDDDRSCFSADKTVLQKTTACAAYIDDAVMAYNENINIKGKFNYAFFDDEYRKKAMRKAEILNKFEEALKNREFKLHFQPKVDLKTNKMAGAETLIRWINEKDGFILPGDFIPVFEESGDIIKLDRYIFEESCKLLRKRINEGKKAPHLSINVSNINLRSSDFVKWYVECKNKYNIGKNVIEIEISESIAMADMDLGVKIINSMKSEGFMFSIDDFGKAYSSIQCLKELRVDIVKMDMFFLDNLFDRAKNQTLVTSVIKLIHSLDMVVVTEGVEHEDEMEFLRQAGCDIVQGYFYSKPINEAAFHEFIDSHV